jgi:hypothetical protein
VVDSAANAKGLDMVTIPGKIVRGMGAATETIRKQMPHFLKVCEELAECKHGTINVIFDCQLDVIPDFTVGPIVWEENGRPELFGFLRVMFEIVEPKSETKAWVYIPYNSAHRLNPFHAEILAPPLLLVGQTIECRVHLKGKRVIA